MFTTKHKLRLGNLLQRIKAATNLNQLNGMNMLPLNERSELKDRACYALLKGTVKQYALLCNSVQYKNALSLHY